LGGHSITLGSLENDIGQAASAIVHHKEADMRIILLKIAALLFGFGISWKCNAADENTPSPNGSSTLPSPAAGPSHVIDGMQKFHELFHLTDNNKISYKVTTDYPPNPALADSLNKQWAALNDASLKAYSQRLRSGFQSVSTYTFYVSKTPKLMMETVEDDEWLKGYVCKIYFTGENVTELEPSAGIVTIYPCDFGQTPGLSISIPGLLSKFPVLYGALDYIPDKLQMVTGSAPTFTVLNKNMPFQFLLKLDSSQSLAETDEIVSGNKNLSVAKFEYSAQSHLWPSSIKADSFGTNGTLQGHEQWDLLKVETLPDGFDFSPNIEANYRVVDKTAQNSERRN
jgi:hypothetical protein